MINYIFKYEVFPNYWHMTNYSQNCYFNALIYCTQEKGISLYNILESMFTFYLQWHSWLNHSVSRTVWTRSQLQQKALFSLHFDTIYLEQTQLSVQQQRRKHKWKLFSLKKDLADSCHLFSLIHLWCLDKLKLPRLRLFYLILIFLLVE